MTAPRLLLALLFLLPGGCRRVPESVLLRIEGSASPAAFLRLSVFDGTGAVVRDRPLLGGDTLLSLPTSVVLYPPAGSGALRIDVRAVLGVAIQAEGTTTATPQPDAQVEARVVLQAGALPDLDGDGVPDAIDSCRALPNPDQRPGSCPVADAATDRPAPRDGGVDAPIDARVDRPRDQGRDQRPPDLKPPDQKPPDLKLPDLKPPDLKPPDLKPLSSDLPVYQPVTAAALSAAFAAASVPCIDAQGQVAGSPISIVDTPAVSFIAPVLATAPATTLGWIAGKPALMVLWNPNACDPVELPSTGGPDWVTAGLLIRGASLDGQNRLQLETGVTLQDIDMVDSDPTGTIAADFFLPDDSALVSFPQLLQPVLTAKQLVLQLAKP